MYDAIFSAPPPTALLRTSFALELQTGGCRAPLCASQDSSQTSGNETHPQPSRAPLLSRASVVPPNLHTRAARPALPGLAPPARAILRASRPTSSTSPLAEIPSPVLKLLEAVFADAGPDVDQAALKVLELNRPDLAAGHVEQALAQAAQRAHGRIFGEGGDVGAGEAWMKGEC